jgi:hypothetical protein
LSLPNRRSGQASSRSNAHVSVTTIGFEINASPYAPTTSRYLEAPGLFT